MKKRNIIGLILVVLLVLVAISLVRSLQGETPIQIELGIAEYQKGNYSKAIEYYSEAIKSDPDNPVPYNNRGLAYLEQKELDRAMSDFDKALDLKPDYEEAHFNRGLAYYHSAGWGDAKIMGAFKKEPYDKAIQEFTKAIEINPRNAETFYQRGLAYTRLVHYYNKPFKPDVIKASENAYKDFKQALALDPEYVLAYAGLGNLSYRNADHIKAIEFYDKALQDPDAVTKRFGPTALAGIYTSRGRNYLCLQGKWAETTADCKKAFELNPRDIHAALLIAVASLLSNNNDETSLWSDRTLAAAKNYPENKGYPYIVWVYFAQPAVAFRQGQIDKALAGFTDLVEKYDSFFEGAAYRHIGLCQQKLGNEKAAQEAFEKGLAWCDKSIEFGLSRKAAEGLCYLAERFLAAAYTERGNIYLCLGKYDEAIANFQEVENMNPVYFAWADPYMDSLVGLIMTYNRMGDTEAARQWYEKAIKAAEDRQQPVTVKRVQGLMKSVN